MDLFSAREADIFESLKELPNQEFVIIGGYAVSAYTLPRFSVDCDLVVKNTKDADAIVKILGKREYEMIENAQRKSYKSSFQRLEKKLNSGLTASFDVLIGAVFDRRTAVSFSADWIFDNSTIKNLRGKTFRGSISSRIINAEALFVLKIVASRQTDLRDVFMLTPIIKNFAFVKREVSKRTDWNEVLKRAEQFVISSNFKKNIEGVYGFIDERTFATHVNALKKLETVN